MTAPTTTLTIDQRRHLIAALRPGHMWRLASGVVVINPAPNARPGAAVAVTNPRRNAKTAVVGLLLSRGWLAEDHNGQFITTAAGRAELDRAEALGAS